MSKTKLVLLTAVTAILSTWLAIGAAVGVYMVVTAPEKEPEPTAMFSHLTYENVEKITFTKYGYTVNDEDIIEYETPDWRALLDEVFIPMQLSAPYEDQDVAFYGGGPMPIFKIYQTDGTVYEIQMLNGIIEHREKSGYEVEIDGKTVPIIRNNEDVLVKINGVIYEITNYNPVAIIPGTLGSWGTAVEKDYYHAKALEEKRANENN